MKKTLLVVIMLMFGFFALLNWLDFGQIKKGGLFPDSNYRPSISQGKISYQSNCMKCHGKNLSGTTKGPSLLDDVYKSSHHADLSFYYAVKNGVRQHHWQFGDMPMVTGVSPQSVSDIISYIRWMQKKQISFIWCQKPECCNL